MWSPSKLSYRSDASALPLRNKQTVMVVVWQFDRFLFAIVIFKTYTPKHVIVGYAFFDRQTYTHNQL